MALLSFGQLPFRSRSRDEQARLPLVPFTSLEFSVLGLDSSAHHQVHPYLGTVIWKGHSFIDPPELEGLLQQSLRKNSEVGEGQKVREVKGRVGGAGAEPNELKKMDVYCAQAVETRFL